MIKTTDYNDVIIHQEWCSPCGWLDLASIGNTLVMSDWVEGWHRLPTLSRFRRLTKKEFETGTSPVIEKAKTQLFEYFQGKRENFDLPLEFIGTDFQKRVWTALLHIPCGETKSYGEIAATVGCQAYQAVGGAVGANPLSIIVPCHRVIGANGKLTGYGGGFEAKTWLLSHERSKFYLS